MPFSYTQYMPVESGKFCKVEPWMCVFEHKYLRSCGMASINHQRVDINDICKKELTHNE